MIVRTIKDRSYYSDSILNFLQKSNDEIIGKLEISSEFSHEKTQNEAWIEEVQILKQVLHNYKEGYIYFEFSIPRMGRRIDVVLLIASVIFVLEFKIGEKEFKSNDIDQVMDYALDLKNFHETSHHEFIAPILIASKAKEAFFAVSLTPQNDKLFIPLKTNAILLGEVIKNVLLMSDGPYIDNIRWEEGHYNPTPTIIEAALALYNNHSVENISRSDAGAINLGITSKAISEIICLSKEQRRKSICFVTGVPGAGKTLVGLHIATTHFDRENDLYSVFLSGNGPLVAILREALVRDKVRRVKEENKKITKRDARIEVKMFIQNVHNFRDECIIDISPPLEHVALFDEAQRAWDLKQTSHFMKNRKNKPNFSQSEPEFLIECMDRHPDWAVVVCLVGGGQEINKGEAGISEWIESIRKSFQNWDIYVSPYLTDSEYNAKEQLESLKNICRITYKNELHLAVSLRSFRTEHVSLLVKQILDLNSEDASETLKNIKNYPIVLTRNLSKAKEWLKSQARGSERYGIIVSSQAERLKPHSIFVKSPMDPVHWFLDDKDDIRSSYYLEDVATEFDVQGLELDWVCITWDADFRYTNEGWKHWSFVGKRWNRIKKEEGQKYLKNAYRVLLTRARQGMVIVVPTGNENDPTRLPSFYDATFKYLMQIGFKVLE